MAIEDATDAQIVAALQRLLASEGAGTFVVLKGDEYRNYYLQFAAIDGRIHCEAVANAFLKAADQLDDQHTAMLENLGWHAPADGFVNWHRIAEPGSEAELVVLARRTLADAYQLAKRAPLAMEEGAS
jgi:hypothetical protein